MKLNKKLMDSLKSPGLCGYCEKPCPDGRDPHHIYTKGAGRIDIPENLISLCRDCHNGFHASGKPSRFELLKISAVKHGTTPDKITDKVYRLRMDS